MGSVVSSITDAVGSVIGGAGDILSGAADVVGDVVDAAGKVVSDIDIEDAVTTYIMTGGNPYAAAFAATSADEKLGFNPAVFYDPSSGFGFADPTVYGGGMPGIESYPGQSIIEPFATQAVTALARSALEQSPSTQQEFANIANLSLEGLQQLQGMIASGEYEKTPSLSFFNAEQPVSNIMDRYASAKANINNIINPPGLLASNKFGIYEDYFKQRGLI